MKNISDKGLAVLVQWEALRTKMYLDSGGEPTIGVGHLLLPEEISTGIIKLSSGDVEWKKGMTKEQVIELLQKDLQPRVDFLNKTLPDDLTQGQFDAMVLFLFNIGVGRPRAHPKGPAGFLGSTLLVKIKAGLYDEVPAQLAKWNKDNGKVVQGLVNRRNAEIELWNG